MDYYFRPFKESFSQDALIDWLLRCANPFNRDTDTRSAGQAFIQNGEGGLYIIFENKLGTEIHDQQVSRYRDDLRKDLTSKYGEGKGQIRGVYFKVLERGGLPRLQLDGLVYPLALAQASNASNWADGLLGGQVPTGRHFVRICSVRLGTPVFRLASQEIIENNRGHGFVERVFQCTTADAMALHEALREYGTADDTR